MLLGNAATIDASGTSQGGNTWLLSGGITGTNVNLTLTGTDTIGGEVGAAISLGAGGSIAKNGPGTWNLDLANAYGGGTAVNAGLLLVSSTGGLGSGPLAVSGGTLDVTSNGLSGIASLAVSGALNVAPTNLVAVGGNVNLAAGSTLNIFGRAVRRHGNADHLRRGGVGTFTHVYLSGLPLPGGDYLTYSGGSIDVISGIVVSGGTWKLNGPSTSWANAANWLSGTVPSGGTVTFAGAPAGSTSVTLDGPQSAGALVFNPSTTNGYTISQGTGGALTLGASAGGSIAVLSATHSIAAPLVLAGPLTVDPTAGTELSISGGISQSPAGQSLTLDGPGELILSGTNSYTGGTFVEAGTLIANTGGAIPNGTSLAVGAGASSITFAVASETAAPQSSAAVAPVPEPGTLALLAAALAVGLGVWRRRKAI